MRAVGQRRGGEGCQRCHLTADRCEAQTKGLRSKDQDWGLGVYALHWCALASTGVRVILLPCLAVHQGARDASAAYEELRCVMDLQDI